MSNSRESILAAIRENRPPQAEYPQIDYKLQNFEDPVARFRELAEAVGGTTFLVNGSENISELCNIPADAKVISAIDCIEDKNLSREDLKTAHDMKDIDYCCFNVELGVAENGALLSHCDEFSFRSVYFLAQHLIVTIKASAIRHNMHEAYKELSDMKRGQFTAFISGPSKTADIEQCLVIGAHGARSMQILIKE
jgi:L-lactate dehydrogenase complex protein LldG